MWSFRLAALYAGKQFLLEKYSLSHIPAFNLIQTDYAKLQHDQILVMDASEFKDQSPLPAAPLELSSIIRELQCARPSNAKEQWKRQSFLNQSFTLSNLQQQVKVQHPNIVALKSKVKSVLASLWNV